jgi:hypothetical protein
MSKEMNRAIVANIVEPFGETREVVRYLETAQCAALQDDCDYR